MQCLLTVIVLYVQIIRGFSKQCENKDLTVLAKTQTPSPDFKPIFTADHITFGVSFQNCLHHCDTNERCIGFEVCQVNENLYRCRGCCEWRRRKKYDTLTGFSMCTFYGKNIDFGNNLAFNKSVTLSSQYHQLSQPSNAVDGITKCPDYTFLASTHYNQNRWLSIQLGGTYNIKMVAIYARTDGHAYDADQTRVIVSDENSTYLCGVEYPGPTQVYDVIDFVCASETVGSNITIVKRHPPNPVLSVCEVEVFGTP